MNIGHLGGETSRLFRRIAPNSRQSSPSKIRICAKFNEMYIFDYHQGRTKEKSYIGTPIVAYESKIKKHIYQLNPTKNLTAAIIGSK